MMERSQRQRLFVLRRSVWLPFSNTLHKVMSLLRFFVCTLQITGRGLHANDLMTLYNTCVILLLFFFLSFVPYEDVYESASR